MRIYAAWRRTPVMAVGIEKTRRDEGVVRIDHLRAGGIELRGDGSDLLAFDQHIALHDVADLGVHADDGAALEQDAVFRIDCTPALEPAQVFCPAGVGETADSCRPRRECGAHLQRTTACDPHVVFHGQSSLCDLGRAESLACFLCIRDRWRESDDGRSSPVSTDRWLLDRPVKPMTA